MTGQPEHDDAALVEGLCRLIIELLSAVGRLAAEREQTRAALLKLASSAGSAGHAGDEDEDHEGDDDDDDERHP